VVGGKEQWRVQTHAPDLLLTCHLALIGCLFADVPFRLQRFTAL
jgi:hypothetical protein